MKRKISPQTSPKKFFSSSLVPSLLLAIIPSITVPVEAAEKLIVNYEGASISVQLDSLEQLAFEGKVEQESLNLVLTHMKPAEQAELRKALQLQENINPIQLNRFLHTPIGEEILTQLGKVINLPVSSIRLGKENL
ncbi:MAG: alpha/beta hydrolase [Prochloraceae cyanobacterium]|nr:alpha/beta hydrolase [Prochloraceae cyanobacterium]